jgi:hypothetical protein
VSQNTLSFERPIKDPIVVLSSIGDSYGKAVDVKFYHSIELLWNENVKVSGQTITGEEGNAIIKIPGTHQEIKFDYLTAEKYVDFFFGHAK